RRSGSTRRSRPGSRPGCPPTPTRTPSPPSGRLRVSGALGRLPGARPKGTAMTKYVYDFSEGNRDMKDLLGGKGANLAEMTNMGLHVPPGFTATTEACLTYLKEGRWPDGLEEEIEEHLAKLES